MFWVDNPVITGYRPSYSQLSKATARLIIWKRVIWYSIIRIPKIGVWGTKHNYMFNVHHNALHILSLSLIDLEGRSVARHLAAAPCSVSRTTAGQGGLKYLLLGLLLASPHDLWSYWSVSQIEIVPRLPRRGGLKAGICWSGPRLRFIAMQSTEMAARKHLKCTINLTTLHNV